MRSAALLLCLTVLGMTACGSDDPGKGLPSSTASNLLQELASVERRLDQGSVGACEDVLEDSVPAFEEQLGALPEATDPSLRTALEDSFAKLHTLSERECDERRQRARDRKRETDTTPVPTPTVPAPPPPTPEPTPPTTTETTPEPDQGDEDKGKGKDKDKGRDKGTEQPKEDSSDQSRGTQQPQGGTGGGVDPEDG